MAVETKKPAIKLAFKMSDYYPVGANQIQH